MFHRVALFVASLTAALVLAFGLAMAGIVPVPAPSGAEPVAATIDPPQQPTVQVDTVYLTPPVAPQDVTVTRTVNGGGEHENEHEGGRDD